MQINIRVIEIEALIEASPLDDADATPLQLADREGHKGIAELLIKHGGHK